MSRTAICYAIPKHEAEDSVQIARLESFGKKGVQGQGLMPSSNRSGPIKAWLPRRGLSSSHVHPSPQQQHPPPQTRTPRQQRNSPTPYFTDAFTHLLYPLASPSPAYFYAPRTMASLLLPRLLRPSPLTIGLTCSVGFTLHHFATHPPRSLLLRADASPSLAGLGGESFGNYQRDAKVPVLKGGKMNPSAVRQFSAGSIAGMSFVRRWRFCFGLDLHDVRF